MGKWRNNGEALEPKWRDGDTIPLLPFSQFSRFSRGKIDNSEEEDDDRRTPKYRQSKRRENFLRGRNNRRLPYNDYDDHEQTEIKREYHERDEISPRKRNRPWNSENAATFEERNDDQNRDIKEDGETSARYREIFQARPNDYEHEFNDEEYLKPRPRKRRPPQNYEFTLVENETSLNEGGTNNNSVSKANNQENFPETTTKNAQNAVELKSLLKMQQEEGLSLSEILQRRNLTLNDLLKGKTDVINALKMRDVEESQDYEETARVMTNSFTRLFTTERPQWTFTTAESAKAKSSQEELVIPIIPASTSLRNSQTSAREPSNKANDGEVYSEVVNATTGKSIPTNVDAIRVTITTPMPLPVATNSMELVQADDAGTKSPAGGEIRAESFDEDEIMEFSDFTDYKKGRNGVSPVWLMMKDGEAGETPKLASSKGQFEDKGSTLSIEKILHPTERSKLTRLANPGNQGPGFNDSDSINKSGTFKEEEQRVTMNHSEEDYSSSSEKEYQSDTPDTVMYYDLEQSTQIDNYTGESDMSKTIMKELESALDAMSRGVNSTLENRRALSKGPLVEKNDSDNLKNHQNINTTGKKSYDDVISEVEPEARAEIFELFASGSAGKRLERLLKSRNMSLEELIALRQRGSSKVHLAEVSRIRAHKSNDKHGVKNTDDLKATSSSSSKERKTIANRENYDKGVNNYLSQSTENLKTIDSSSNSMDLVRLEDGTTEQLIPKLESTISNEDIELNTSPRMDIEKDERERHRTVEIVDLLTTFDSFPFIKDIQREFTDQYDKEDKRKLLVQDSNVGVMFVNNDAEMIRVNDTSNIVESGFVKEIVKQEPSSIDIQAVYGKTGNILDEDESRSKKGKSLSKVKPSIIASGAILGVTLVVFLAIFIVCRIRQKQKYRYKNTFSRAVFQGPVMTARKLSNSSSLSTVMVNVVATSTTKRPEKNENQEPTEMDSKSDIDNDSLDANDSWETIPDYMK